MAKHLAWDTLKALKQIDTQIILIGVEIYLYSCMAVHRETVGKKHTEWQIYKTQMNIKSTVWQCLSSTK